MAGVALLLRLAGVGLLVAAALAGDGGTVLAGAEARYYPATPDYVDIDSVPARPGAAAVGPDAATGSWDSPCGRNENGHYNADNPVVSPGRKGGAEHLHDYVGNVSTTAYTTDLDLALAGTTCRNGDTSTYYWPVVGLLPGHNAGADDAGADQAGVHHAGGGPVLPASVLVRFLGNPRSKVVPMPRFLRMITGDAKAVTAPAPDATAAQWTCSGARDRRTERYPLCPPKQRVLRIFDFPSCWDGLRADSPNHRSHVVFPATDGSCPGSAFPIPQLHIEVGYSVPAGRSYAVDTFPDQHRSPRTDHAGFIDVMPDALMARLVDCLNTGRRC
jgi:hypothetical protein